MKSQEALGMVIGSLIGAVLAGIGAYFKIPLVCILMLLLICLSGGWYVGKQVKKRE